MVSRLQETPGYTPGPQEASPAGAQQESVVSPPTDNRDVVSPPTTQVPVGEGLQYDPGSPSQAPQEQDSIGQGLSATISSLFETLSPEQPEAQYDEYNSMFTKPEFSDVPAPTKVSSAPAQDVTGGYSSVIPSILNPGAREQKNTPSAGGNYQVREIGSESITDMSPDVGGNWNFPGPFQPNGLVIHHTDGRPTVDGVIQTFKERGYPAHFIIDRDGKIVQVLGIQQRGSHTKPSEFKNLDYKNSNTWGVEIIAKNDKDVTEEQVQAAIDLSEYLHTNYNMPLDRVIGHGEINPSTKQKDEGYTVTEALRAQLVKSAGTQKTPQGQAITRGVTPNPAQSASQAPTEAPAAAEGPDLVADYQKNLSSLQEQLFSEKSQKLSFDQAVRTYLPGVDPTKFVQENWGELLKQQGHDVNWFTMNLGHLSDIPVEQRALVTESIAPFLGLKPPA